MTRPLRIVVADDERETREFLRELLTRLGHRVATAEDGPGLVGLCRECLPDLIVTDVRMPGMDGFEAARLVNAERETPVILVTAYHEEGLPRQAGAEHVMAYLVKPVKPPDVEAAVSLALARFEQFQALRRESRELRQALEDRKLIERAKGAVMRRLGISEDEAFRRLREYSSDHNRKIVELAREVMAAEEVFHNLEKN